MHNHCFPPDSLEHRSGGTLDALAAGQAHAADDTRAQGAVYGYEIHADFALSRLRTDSPERRGALHLRLGALPRGPLVEIARDPDERGPAWVLAHSSAGLVSRFTGLGQMGLDVTAGTIVCEPESNADPAEWENRVLCSGVTQLLASRGELVVHASAVVYDGRAALFCGPAMAGKSTITLALASLGFELLSEDAAVVTGLPARPLVWPGPEGVRVRENSGAKVLYSGPEIPLRREPAPLAAVFVIGSRSDRELTIEPLSPAHMTAAIMRHSAFVGVPERRRLLRLACGLAAGVPGFVLRAPDGIAAFRKAAGDLAERVVRICDGPKELSGRRLAKPAQNAGDSL